jgi:hypothetical protein
MLGKAVGARDERDRIAEMIQSICENEHDSFIACDCAFFIGKVRNKND